MTGAKSASACRARSTVSGCLQQARVGRDPDEGPFEFADGAFDAAGHQRQDVVRQEAADVPGLGLEDAAARRGVGGQQPHDHARDAAADEAVLDGLDLARMRVGGQDDQAAPAVVLVEGVQELFLRRGFAGQEMDVVDGQHVEVAVAVAEGVERACPHAREILIRELLGREARHPQAAPLLQGVQNALQKVGFAQAAGAVDEERMEVPAGAVDGRAGRRVGHLVARADDEILERKERAGCRRRAARAARPAGAGAGRLAQGFHGLGGVGEVLRPAFLEEVRLHAEADRRGRGRRPGVRPGPAGSAKWLRR